PTGSQPPLWCLAAGSTGTRLQWERSCSRLAIGRWFRRRNSIPSSAASTSGTSITRTTIPLAPQLLRRHRESGRPYRHQRRSARNGGGGGTMFLKEFKDLRRKRDKLRGLPDQLNYAIPIDDYTIALKDGAFLSAFDCSGLDLNSASVEELDAHRAQGNRALARLDDGFQYNIDLFRYPSVEYASRTFPDPVSAALDREREIQYSAEGQHFETRC